MILLLGAKNYTSIIVNDMLFSISRLGSISTFHEKRKKPQKKGKNVPTNSILKFKTCLGFNLTYGRNHRHQHTSWDVKKHRDVNFFLLKKKNTHPVERKKRFGKIIVQNQTLKKICCFLREKTDKIAGDENR